MDRDIEAVAADVREADALLISAGAGMGVDSGLPEFRGVRGLWTNESPYARLGLDPLDVAHPRRFNDDPELAWGFYGQRLEQYRRAVPHAGFHLLRRWGEGMRLGCFVYTSNVDGQFQRSGFDPSRIVECHGALDYLQCLERCGIGIFAATGVSVDVDSETLRARGPLPQCPRCGALARPNVQMFGDHDWEHGRVMKQDARLTAWLASVRHARVVLIECGAGTAVPAVRRFDEELARKIRGLRLVRINPREPQVPRRHRGLATGALAALRAIDTRLAARLLSQQSEDNPAAKAPSGARTVIHLPSISGLGIENALTIDASQVISEGSS